MIKKIEEAKNRGTFIERDKEKELALLHMGKSGNNMLSARVERLLLKDEVLRANPAIKGYDTWDRLIIKSYYAMYHIVLALLAKLGIKTKTHHITLIAFELFFVKKKIVDKKYLNIFNEVKESAKVTEEYLDELKDARQKRFAANYDVESTILEKDADECLEKAEEFINEMKYIYNKFDR